MAEAPLPDDPGMLVPVSYKVVHEVRAHETDPKLRDLVQRLGGSIQFDGRRVLYSWIGATRRDWRGQGHFRALTEESEAWAVARRLSGSRRQDQEPLLRHAQHADPAAIRRGEVRAHRPTTLESKVYMSKMLSAEMVSGHRSMRSVVQVD